ncbi:MAG: asparaginase [Nitriliruptoraceae bacterium]
MTAARGGPDPAGQAARGPAERRPRAPLVAELTRRDVRTGVEHVESGHTAHLVVSGPDGEVVASCGDALHPTFVRSTAKPVQATACLEVLDASDDPDPGPGPAELAVAWASHRGEPVHLAAVRGLLRRSGTPPTALTCPPATAEASAGAPPSRLQHNCSGKHALFALAGARLGLSGAALLDPEAALQRRVLATLEEVFGPPLAVGVDGCGAPAIAVPLAPLATGFAKLAVEPRFSRVRDAGRAHPDLVGGQGRLESALLSAGVLAKVGAEGVYGVGWLDADGRPWGLAIKAVDGAARGVAAVTVELLASIGVVPEGTWCPPSPLGGGRPVGVIRTTGEVARLRQVLLDVGVAAGSR